MCTKIKNVHNAASPRPTPSHGPAYRKHRYVGVAVVNINCLIFSTAAAGTGAQPNMKPLGRVDASFYDKYGYLVNFLWGSRPEMALTIVKRVCVRAIIL